jgi:hypothetical protein
MADLKHELAGRAQMAGSRTRLYHKQTARAMPYTTNVRASCEQVGGAAVAFLDVGVPEMVLTLAPST